MTDPVNDVAKLARLAKDIRITMLTTTNEEGQFISRPMAQQEVEFDGTLWFFAERMSRKVLHIIGNPRVGVTMTSSDSWISIFGTAEMIEDPAKKHELWNPWVEAWLPQGPDDPTVVLIKVTGTGAEYWDTPGGRIASVISFVKSKVTGQRYDGGDNEKVEL